MFERVELSVLVFFAALFVIVGGLEHVGVLKIVAEKLIAGAESNMTQTSIIVLCVSAILSAIVDNIMFTVAMIPIIGNLGDAGVNVNLLWWALVFGVEFGGNGSPIGSTANIIVVSKSEQTETPITFKSWFASGTLAMLATLIVATFAILLFVALFGRTTCRTSITLT